jgi:hypothetical protein
VMQVMSFGMLVCNVFCNQVGATNLQNIECAHITPLKMEHIRECDHKPSLFHPRKRVNRKTKCQLLFDENARR